MSIVTAHGLFRSKCSLLLSLVLLTLAGCASGPHSDGSIYVPVGQGQTGGEEDTAGSREPAAEEAQGGQEAGETSTDTRPRHRQQGQAISPAAASLVKQADAAFRADNVGRGMALLQRAQRISPDAAVIYYKMAEGSVRQQRLAQAEQFARKGVSLAGSDPAMQKSGWQLLADIRRAQGNVAGAQSAEERASAL